MGERGRFLLCFRGRGDAPELDGAALSSLPQVTLLDDADGRRLLVEGPESIVRRAVELLAGWEVADDSPPLRNARDT